MLSRFFLALPMLSQNGPGLALWFLSGCGFVCKVTGSWTTGSLPRGCAHPVADSPFAPHMRPTTRSRQKRRSVFMTSCTITLHASVVTVRVCSSVIGTPGLVADGLGRKTSWASTVLEGRQSSRLSFRIGTCSFFLHDFRPRGGKYAVGPSRQL